MIPVRFYEVLIADGHYRGTAPLTYSYDGPLSTLSVVVVPLRNRTVTGFVLNEVPLPQYKVRPIKNLLSEIPLPFHCLELAEWIRDYYICPLGEALRQFAPSSTVVKRKEQDLVAPIEVSVVADQLPLTVDQVTAVDKITTHPSTSILLHGETGSGKTRIYLEVADRTLKAGKSVIFLTPEIALTGQLAKVIGDFLKQEIIVLHSELTTAERKKIWFRILEAREPIVVVGPRSALFAPINNVGLIVVDEVHEPAYKQEQNPRYHSVRVASQLGLLTGARVILGSATPLVTDYFLAKQKNSIVRIENQAKTGAKFTVDYKIINLQDRQQFKKNQYISDYIISNVQKKLDERKQVLFYYNRRGSARVIMCDRCGWHMNCPNCDVSLVYHADEHLARCHTCGYKKTPPKECPNCKNPDIVFKAIGSKALEDMVRKLFPSARVQRFDSDNIPGERLNELYKEVVSGQVDILVGTQLLAKGLDLPKLGLVAIISADTSLALPDYTAEERTYQLLYQVIGRVGRGHTDSEVILQTYDPDSIIVKAALKHNWEDFYQHEIVQRRDFRFPPFSYLLKLTCRRATAKGALNAAEKLKETFQKAELPVEIIGPAPSFYFKSGKYFNYQLVIKSKQRSHLVTLAAITPSGWTTDLDPADLL